jgi:hypothetical protein
MKKALASILLLIYFTVSTGFSVNMHYCMDTFSSWDFGAVEGDSCDLCGMAKDKGNDCCRDEVKVLKLQQEMPQAKDLTYQIYLPSLIHTTWGFNVLSLQNGVHKEQHFNPRPRLLHQQEIYLRNCVFRI